eukprot:6001799-Amphidinium_carterae.2
MSSEDHNLVTMLEDVKTQKVAIVDANYIDYYLHEQGLGQKDEDEIHKARRREGGEDGVPIDEAVPPFPELPDTFQPFDDEQ